MNMRCGGLVVALLLVASVASAQATAPVITSIDPTATIVGTGSFELTVNGANFVTGNSVVRVNGSNRPTTFVSASRLRATIQTGDVLTERTLTITVFSSGRISNSAPLEVLPNDPRIDTLSPDTVGTGTTTLTVRITGANFASTAKARVNGSERDTTFVNATTLDFLLRPADVATPRTLTISVANPSSHFSNNVNLQVRSGALTPELTLLDPATVVAAGPAFTLKITGRNFDRLAVVKFDTTQRTPTFIDAQHLEVQVLSTQIITAREISVTVVNPGNLVSNALPLKVDAEATPTINTVTPESLTVNTRSLTITVDGTNFENGAKVRVGGVDRNTTFVSSTRVTGSLLTSDVSTVRELAVTVKNPGTAGRESASKTLFVIAANGPTISSIAPTSITAGTVSPRIVVTGTNYLDGDAVLVAGAPRETQFISATQMAATLLDSDVATPRELLVTVRKTSNGAVSAPFTLRVIDAATPFIESFDPESAAAGAGPFTLTIRGSNFAPDSTVTLAGRSATTRYVSSTELSVDVLATDIAAAGVIPVIVANSGGSSSAPVNFLVELIVPSIASLDPTSVPAGDPGFTLNVSGTNFSSTAVVNFDGIPQSGTRFNSATGSLSLIVPSSQLTVARLVAVTVTDRDVTSAPKSLVVAAPFVENVDPSVIVAGGADVNVTVTGANFVPGSRVSFKGGERPTTFVSSTRLTSTIPFTALREIGEFALAVFNTADAVSNPFPIQIASPGLPTIFSISPTTITAGTSSQLVVITGANFLSGARIRVNGVPRETAFVSTTELALFLTADDMRSAGALTFSVVAATGEVSNNFTITVIPRPPTGGKRRAVDVP
jgi:hypothetical protein